MKPLSLTAVSFIALAAASFSLPTAAADVSTSGASKVDVQTTETTVTVTKENAVSSLAMKDPDVLNGQTIVTWDGKKLGKINKVLQDPRDDKIYVAADADDFFDEDVNDVMIPVGELSLHSDNTLMISQGMETELKNMVFDEDNLKVLSD